MNERRKDVLETAAAGALALAGAVGLSAAAIPGAVGIAFHRFQERRSQAWWNRVIHGATEPDALVAQIEAGLATDDVHVVAGIVGGARAAASSVELAAVSVIAELSRRYISTRDLPRWFFRAALELFEQLEASDLFALRTLLHEIEPIRSESIAITGDIGGEARPWRAHQLTVSEPSHDLTPFPTPSRLFGYLKRVGLGYESQGIGYVGSPRHVVLDRDVATWLREAMTSGEPPVPMHSGS